MATTISNEINNRILEAEDGAIFLTSDFSDLASNTTVRKCLGRQTEKGNIKRVMDGVYEKPRYSSFLKEILPTSPEAVAYAIARGYHWNISPAGDVALNKLGLSTQVPSVWVFVSDGPYREFEIENAKLSFKHRTNRDISNMSTLTVMIIEALKTLGKERVDESIIKTLRNKIAHEDKELILMESADSAEWIHETIRKVCC